MHHNTDIREHDANFYYNSTHLQMALITFATSVKYL